MPSHTAILPSIGLLLGAIWEMSVHSFDPPAASPVSGATVDLEVSEIEDASIREVLQTPGAAYGAWSSSSFILGRNFVI